MENIYIEIFIISFLMNVFKKNRKSTEYTSQNNNKA